MILSVADRTIITHPEISDGSIDLVPGGDKMIKALRGTVSYMDDHGVRWRAGIVYFVPKQWIIVVTAREDEILHNSDDLITRLTMISVLTILLPLYVFYRLNRSLLYTSLTSVRKDSLF